MTLMVNPGNRKLTRAELARIPTPDGTRTHQPFAHARVVELLAESLAFRRLLVLADEYAVSPDGMKMFGVLDLADGGRGFRFSLGVRNSNDKTMRLALTAGYRVLVCENMAFKGDFTPVLHKHTHRLSLQEVVALGVERIQRGFAPLREQIAAWQDLPLADREAKEVVYDAFLKAAVAPRHLLPVVHKHYFEPQYEEFEPRTFWSLSNAFTSAFKQLKPVRQFQATARLGAFLHRHAAAREADTRFALPPAIPEAEAALTAA
jgi:hypothetical protein